MRSRITYSTFALAMCVCTSSVWAQQLNIPQRGVVPNGFYEVSEIETIDAVSGSVSLQIPITSFPPGRAGLTHGIELLYNSRIYTGAFISGQFALFPVHNIDPSDSAGWRYGYQYSVVTDVSQYAGISPCTPGSAALRLIMPDGSSHRLYGTATDLGSGYYIYYLPGCGTPTALTGTFYTADGTYLRVDIDSNSSWTLRFPDGRTVAGPTGGTANTITDRNGNKITISGNGTTTVLTDDLGRTITISHTANQDVITQSGYNGQQLQWTVNWTTVTIPSSPAHTYLCVPGNPSPCTAAGVNLSVVSSIQLPSGLTYQFQSDVNTGWGQLSQITLPSGASVNYTYSNNWDYNNPTPGAIASKIVSWTDENDSPGSPRTETTTYSFSTTSSTFTHPDGGSTMHFFYDPSSPQTTTPYAGLVYRVESKDANLANVTSVERIWSQNVPYGADGCGSNCQVTPYHFPGNPYVQTEFNVDWEGTSSALAAARTYTLDRNGNRIQVDETDWFPYANITHYGLAPTGFSGATTMRTTQNTYNLQSGVATSDYTLNDTNGYWNSLAYPLLSLPCQIMISGSPGATTQIIYDGNTSACSGGVTKGNATSVRRWNSATSAYETTTNSYDSFGNLTATTDPRNNTSQYTYDASNLYVAQMNRGSGARTLSYTHDSNTGVLTSITDTDHGSWVRSFSFDQYGRVTSDREGSVRQTNTAYNDNSRQITVYTDKDSNGDRLLQQNIFYDQLGRVRKTQDPAGNIIQTRYMVVSSTPGTCGDATGGGTFELVSNPYITQGEPTMGWTRTRKDYVGRVIEVKHFSGSALPEPWDANCTSTGASTYAYGLDNVNNRTTVTATDEASVSTTRSTDGLGRLVSVVENGIGATTTYGYDVLDDLTSVTQGSTTRSFSYSSLKRLISATNPESGTISYAYDGNGNLLTKTDARNITTTYTYDNLDQVSTKTYSDGTPTVTYTYSHDWLTGVSSSASAYSYTRDTIGRVNGGAQTTGGQTYTFTVSLKPFVGIDWIQYPNSNRKITTGYDSYGRAASVTGQIGAGAVTNYASAISYTPHGGITSITLGNGLAETRSYNARLQPGQIQLGSLLTIGFGYSATQNNGNLASQTITRGAQSWTESYSYDGANRLSAASESGAGTWAQNYGFDTRGNRWVSSYSGLPALTSETPQTSSWYLSNNRISGWGYDAAGNITTSGTGRTASYDAENRQTSVTVNSQTTTYTYDGDGQRVTKAAPSGTTVYVYDPFGNLAQEYGPVTDSGTRYVTSDHLGSTRLVTDASAAQVKCYDYLPFGEEIGNGTAGRGSCFGSSQYPASADVLSAKFTSKERDAETGLDFFGARYMSSAQGRWTSPDAVNLIDDRILNPSNTLNKYIYGGNNPLKYTDPDGRDITVLYQSGWPTGHIMLAAYNQQTSDFAILSVGPQTHFDPGIPLHPFKGVPGTTTFDLADLKTADDLRHNFTALTIQTSPEVAQQAINAIRNGAGTGNWALLGNNCTSACAKVLRDIGLSTGSPAIAWTPDVFFRNLAVRYGRNRPPAWMSAIFGNLASQLFQGPATPGMDWGNPRYGIDPFDFIMLQINIPLRACVTTPGLDGGPPETVCE
jgi:RHS repeat-associated protein